MNERVRLLEEAGDLISTAIENIEIALKGTDNYNHAKSYIIPHLNTWIGNGNPHDTSVYNYIEQLTDTELTEDNE